MWTILAVLAGLEFLGSVLPRSLSWWLERKIRQREEELQVLAADLAARLGITPTGCAPLADDIVTAVDELRGELAATQDLLRDTY